MISFSSPSQSPFLLCQKSSLCHCSDRILRTDMPEYCLSRAVCNLTFSANQPNSNPTFALHPLALPCSKSQPFLVMELLTGANATRCDCMTTDDVVKIHLRIRRLGVRISPSALVISGQRPYCSMSLKADLQQWHNWI